MVSVFLGSSDEGNERWGMLAGGRSFFIVNVTTIVLDAEFPGK
jgi:hypothetical protein